METVVTYAGLVAVGIAYRCHISGGRKVESFSDRWYVCGIRHGSVDLLASCCSCRYIHVFLVMGGGAVITSCSVCCIGGQFHLTSAGLMCHIVCDVQFASLFPQTHQHSDNDNSCCDEY